MGELFPELPDSVGYRDRAQSLTHGRGAGLGLEARRRFWPFPSLTLGVFPKEATLSLSDSGDLILILMV
jgi:hypothetical protein